MVALSLQRSPRRNTSNLTPQLPPPSRLHRSASVPKLSSSLSISPLSNKNPPSLSTTSPKSPLFRHPAPYPLSYQNSTLNCDALDNLILKNLRKSSSWVDFPSSVRPTRCLDLGCGAGAWVLDAALEWPDCKFVGFDLVDIQPPPNRLGPQFADRIKWVHGNFLNILPFEDAYFDHVHIRQIARGVPEHAWDHVLSEVVRVLKDGGTVELFEEDIIFPVLPRSSTATPRQRQRKRSALPHPTPFVTTYHPADSILAHDHAVLEVLFYRIFERRFINLRPTALIMGLLDVHLRGAGGSPLINFPLPPPPPLPLSPSGSRAATPRLRLCSTSRSPAPDADTDLATVNSSRRSRSDFSTPATSVEDLDDPADGPVAFYSDAGLASVSAPAPSRILPKERLATTEGTLGLNLYRSWQGVMSCREALWEEYSDAVQRKEKLISQIDWEEHELSMSERKRFEALLARYKADMEARYSISDALVSDLQWTKPQMEVSKEDEQERRAMAEARSDALRLERSGIGAVPEASKVCRKMRIFVARKGAVYRMRTQ